MPNGADKPPDANAFFRSPRRLFAFDPVVSTIRVRRKIRGKTFAANPCDVRRIEPPQWRQEIKKPFLEKRRWHGINRTRHRALGVRILCGNRVARDHRNGRKIIALRVGSMETTKVRSGSVVDGKRCKTICSERFAPQGKILFPVKSSCALDAKRSSKPLRALAALRRSR